jgi:hypothetical protein
VRRFSFDHFRSGSAPVDPALAANRRQIPRKAPIFGVLSPDIRREIPLAHSLLDFTKSFGMIFTVTTDFLTAYRGPRRPACTARGNHASGGLR